MPGSKRTYSYVLVPRQVEDTERLLKRTVYHLGWACDMDKRITHHETSSGALGAVTMTMVIEARDRWWSAQLAQDILNKILWGLERDSVRLELASERQEPHTHRGYAHGRTKRYRERNGSKATKPDPQSSESSSESSESSSSSSA